MIRNRIRKVLGAIAAFHRGVAQRQQPAPRPLIPIDEYLAPVKPARRVPLVPAPLPEPEPEIPTLDLTPQPELPDQVMVLPIPVVVLSAPVEVPEAIESAASERVPEAIEVAESERVPETMAEKSRARAAQVEALLDEASQQGITAYPQLIEFVRERTGTGCSRRTIANWKAARQVDAA